MYIYIYSSLSTLAGLSYHICGKLEVAFKASPCYVNNFALIKSLWTFRHFPNV